MKKSVIVLGSSRSNGNTYKIAAELSGGLIPIIDLGKLRISNYDYDHKNSDDDYLDLMTNLISFENIVLATPVYWYTMSAVMKTFIDRLSDLLSIKKDIGRALSKKNIFILASYGTSFPIGFEEPFRQTCNYMKMEYQGCFYHKANTKVTDSEEWIKFRKKILTP